MQVSVAESLRVSFEVFSPEICFLLYLLSVGQEVQRASVISNLPSLVRQNPAETFRRVVPKVRVRTSTSV